MPQVSKYVQWIHTSVLRVFAANLARRNRALFEPEKYGKTAFFGAKIPQSPPYLHQYETSNSAGSKTNQTHLEGVSDPIVMVWHPLEPCPIRL